MDILSGNLAVALFYGAIILILVLNRKKFEVQGKIVALYKTKVGIKLMDKIAKKHKETIKILGYSGIGIGLAGMIFISFILLQNMWNILTDPNAQSAVSPVIPGVHIPGAVLTPPLIIGWAALFFVIVIHEFSHGVVARAHDVKIKSSGLAFFGPLMGAFVEPAEKQLKKKGDVAEYSVFAAGPFSNIILGALALLIGTFLIVPMFGLLTEPSGFSIETIQEGYPAETAGMQPGTIVNSVNGVEVIDYSTFTEQMEFVKVDQEITLGTEDSNYTLKTVQNPNDAESKIGYLGIAGLRNELELKNDNLVNKVLLSILSWIKELFVWVYILSLGIGLANLLPLGPVDGGRMALLALTKTKGTKRGTTLWKKLSLITLFVLLLNLLWPLLKWIGSKAILVAVAAL